MRKFKIYRITYLGSHTVPYLSKNLDKFREVLHNLDVGLSFYSLNKLGGVIKMHKEIFPKLSIKIINKDVVYKICNLYTLLPLLLHLPTE